MNLEELPMRTTVESNVNYSYQFTTVIITLFEKKTTKKKDIMTGTSLSITNLQWQNIKEPINDNRNKLMWARSSMQPWRGRGGGRGCDSFRFKTSVWLISHSINIDLFLYMDGCKNNRRRSALLFGFSWFETVEIFRVCHSHACWCHHHAAVWLWIFPSCLYLSNEWYINNINIYQIILWAGVARLGWCIQTRMEWITVALL